MCNMHLKFTLAAMILTDKFLFGDAKFDWDCLSQVAKSAVRRLNWRRAALIHDNESVAIIQHLERFELMVYSEHTGIMTRSVLQQIHAKLFPDVNVILASETADLLTRFLYEADRLDIKMNHSTDWSHHSKWLVFAPTLSDFHVAGLTLKNLQNVALFTQQSGECVDAVNSFSLKRDGEGYKFYPADLDMSIPFTIFPNTKYRYNGQLLRVSTLKSYRLVVPDESKVADDIPYTGYCIEILRTIAEHLNLTLKYVRSRDAVWGWIDNGMMGQLTRREIDLVANEMIVRVERAQHMDYITPYLFSDELILLYKMPQGREPIFLLARPFQASVYMTYLAVIFGVAIMFALFEHLSASPEITHKSQVWFLLWNVIRSSLKQGDGFACSTVPGRILLASWWVVVIIISCLYCGNLTASLATSSSLVRFHSIDELVDSDFSIGFVPGSIVEQILKNSSRESFRRLSMKIQRMNATDSSITSSSKEDHIQRMKNGKYAFLTYALYVDYLANSDCTLSKLRVGDAPQEPSAFVVQKDSPFKDDINSVMHRLYSTGILDKLWKKWTHQAEPKKCVGGKQNVTVSELSGGIIVAGAGIVLATVMFLFERGTAHIFKYK